MIVGWREGEHGAELRATHADREAVLRLLHLAENEGRLDATECHRRESALSEAKTRADVARLAADLPNRRGVPDWIDQLRVSREHRDQAVRLLAQALTQGRLTVPEYQRRAGELPAVTTYAELKRLLAGLPGVPDAADGDVLVSDDERERALATLTAAVADGRVKPGQQPVLAAEIECARRIADLDALLVALDARADDRERRQVLQRLDDAYRDGQLDVAEQARRAGLAHAATTSADLAQLVADLHGGGRRPTTGDRKRTAGALRRALNEGRLDLAEYDQRVSAAYEAGTAGDLAALVADLADPPRPPRRGVLDAAFDRWVVNSALLPARQRRVLKWSWVAGIVAIPLGWISLLLTVPWLAVVLVIFPPPLMMLFMAFNRVVSRLGRAARDRQAALIEEIRAALEDHPAVTSVRVSVGPSKTVEVDAWTEADRCEEAGPAGPSFIDEAVRILWLSPLYPLTKIEIVLSAGLGSHGTVHKVRLRRAVTRDLRERYGPRPYGALER